MGLLRRDRQFACASLTPAHRRDPAAAALQWKNQVKHGISVVDRGDTCFYEVTYL
jgi:hypothetical protein